jgi:hypothetical protein
MSKFCKKCGKEIPQTSKGDTCDNCQNKKWGPIRKVLSVGGGIVVSVALLIPTRGRSALVAAATLLSFITKGKSGGPKA